MTKSPDAFRTISEVAAWLGVQAHVLRFWESKFSQIKPVKRAGGRRYYRPSDMRLIGGIKTLLHDDGMTIKGVQKILREQGVAHVAALSQPLEGEAVEATAEEAHGTVLPFKAKPGAPAAEAQAPGDKPAPGPAAPGLPAFLNRPETPATPPASASGQGQADAPAPAPDTAASEESEPPYTPGPLGHLAGLTKLSTAQAAQIAPLVRALRAWYDRNANAGWG